MPEVAENDPLLFPALKKAKDPQAELETIRSQLDNSVVQKVGRHGKYFWIRFNGNKVMLMHFGMTGMVKLRGIKSHMVFMENGGDQKVKQELEQDRKSKYFKKESDLEEELEAEEWPPRFNKMELEFQLEEKTIDFSFVDPRRLGRVRILTDIASDEDLFKVDPMNRQGPDYSKPDPALKKQDEEFVTGDADPETYGVVRPDLVQFQKLILSKKKSIKSLLLDQQYFAGVGNWVGDEVLYQARIHPEEVLSDKISPKETEVSQVIQNLYNSLIDVCKTAVSVEGYAKQFPEDWLMLHRWGKRRKKQEKPKVNGEVIDFVTVGGRTSCYVPAVQKKIKKQ